MYQKRKWSLFASVPVSSGFSEDTWKLAISLQQGEGGKGVRKTQSERKPLLPASGAAERDLGKPSALCVHCEMSCSSDVSNYASFCLSMFVPAFLQTLSGECRR